MPMNFPDTPTNGQTFTSGGVAWMWNGSTWDTTSSPSGPFLLLTGGTLSNPGNLTVNGTTALTAATATTPATANNSTSVATTAFVKAQAYVTGGPYLALTGGTLTGPVTFTGTAPQITLSNTTSNWMMWLAYGTAPPAFTTRSAGTKLVLYPSLSSSSADYAIGIDSGTLWHSVGTTGNNFAWYGGTTLQMQLADGYLGIGTGAAGVFARVTVSGLGVVGQGTAAFNTAGSLVNVLMLDDVGVGVGNGGTILFSANQQVWRFATIQGWVTSGSNNSQGDIVFSTRRVSTDATLTEALRVVSSGLTQTNGGFRTGGGVANIGSFTWAQLNTTFNVLANSGAIGIGWNYTGGGGETDVFINRGAGTAGGLRIYDFPNASGAVTQLLSLTGAGALTLNNTIFATSTGTSPVAGQFHMSNGSGYGSFWYNDGNTTYLLLTASGDYLGTYNSLRPFYADNATGNVSMGSALSVTGNVSMGSGSALTVNGNIFVTGNGHVVLGPNSTGQLYVESTNNNYVFILPSGNGAYYFYNAGGSTSLMSLSGATGNLTLYGNLTSANITTTGSSASFVFNDRTGTAPTAWQLYSSGGWAKLWNSTGGDTLIFTNPHIQPAVNNNTWCGLPTANGNAWYGCGAYQFATQSDIQFKTDIEDVPDCLDFVRALAPKRYRFNNCPIEEEKDIIHWGFIAQHVGEAFKGHNFGGHRIDHGENGSSQSLIYSELVAVLWKAVQELSAEMTALKARLA